MTRFTPFIGLFSSAVFFLFSFSASAAFPSTPLPNTPSFPCDSAQTPTEALVCSDPSLRQLDRLAGRTLVTVGPALMVKSQKTHLKWLNQQAKACRIAETGDPIPEKERPRAVSCLGEIYRKYLIGLGRKPISSPSLSLNGVHPFCLIEGARTLDNKVSPIDLGACTAANADFPVTRALDGSLSSLNPTSAPLSVFATWGSYRMLGVLSDGREVAHIVHNTHSAGIAEFHRIIAYTRKTAAPAETLVPEILILGGDRANEGIKEASLDKDRLIIDFTLTPAHTASTLGLTNDDGIGDLPDCAVCSFAIGRYEKTDLSRPPSLLHNDQAPIALFVDYLGDPAPRIPGADGCLADALIKVSGRNSRLRIEARDFPKVAKAFRACRKR